MRFDGDLAAASLRPRNARDGNKVVGRLYASPSAGLLRFYNFQREALLRPDGCRVHQ